MRLAEASDQSRIHSVGLGTQQFALSERFHAARIFHADDMTALVQVNRQRFFETAGRLGASMDRLDLTILQPGCKLWQPGFVVREALGPRALAEEKGGIESVFADVDAKKRKSYATILRRGPIRSDRTDAYELIVDENARKRDRAHARR